MHEFKLQSYQNKEKKSTMAWQFYALLNILIGIGGILLVNYNFFFKAGLTL
jgi:hypothetical protein